MSQQHAFICILKDYTLIESLLLTFIEHGVTGGTVIDGRGMGQILCQDIPIFAHLRDRFPDSDSDSHLLLSVVSEGQLELCFELAERVMGAHTQGLAFSILVGRMRRFGHIDSQRPSGQSELPSDSRDHRASESPSDDPSQASSEPPSEPSSAPLISSSSAPLISSSSAPESE